MRIPQKIQILKFVGEQGIVSLANSAQHYNEQLLTPKQLSEWLQIKLSTIYKWSHSGYIPCIKLGGQNRGSLRFSRGDILPWLKRRTRRGRSTYRLETDGIDLN